MFGRGFVTNKKVEELLPVEALVFVNRWAKSDNFYYEDRDALYDLKDGKIHQWLKSEELKITGVIERESEVIRLMREEIAKEGENLEWLNFLEDPYHYLTEEENKNQQLFYDLTSNLDYFVEYPLDIYQSWIAQLQPEIEAYKIAKEEYDREFGRRQPIIDRYNRDCIAYQQKKQSAAKQWAKKNKVKIARSNSGKSLKKDWLERLEKQGFNYPEAEPPNPFAKKLKQPKPVQYPDKTYSVSFDTYVPGSIPEIEKALDWARTIIDLPPTWEIDEDFVCHNLDEELNRLVLERIISQDILPIFQQVVEGKLTNPQKIYDLLTEYPINYEAIGIENHYNFRYHQTSHRYFGKWHEINLSPTGLWLVEFQSTIDPTITFHQPYNKFVTIAIKDNKLKDAPRISSNREKYGRAIGSEEAEQYPIEKLLEILGYSVSDFPCELEPYSSPTLYRFFSDWKEDEDEDWDWD